MIDEKRGLIMFMAGGVTLFLVSLSYMTLPEAQACRISYDNGDVLEGNCTALKEFHEARLANALVDVVEYQTLLDNYTSKKKCPTCPIVTCPPQDPCVCPECVLPNPAACVCAPPECPEFNERHCTLTPQMGQDIRKLRPPPSNVNGFQGGYFYCKKDVIKILDHVG